MDWSWLALLMCPLMMIPMFLMMMKGSHSKKTDEAANNVAREIIDLKKQNERMQQVIEQLNNKVKS